jgi:hypothetical protein
MQDPESTDPEEVKSHILSVADEIRENPLLGWRCLLDAKPIRGLAQKEMELLITLLSMKPEQVADSAKKSNVEKGLACAIIMARLQMCVPQWEWDKWYCEESLRSSADPTATPLPEPERHMPHIEQACYLFVGMIVESPGRAVQWAYTLAVLCAAKNGSLLTLKDWCEAFPFGIPTDDAAKATWLYQKVDNRITNIDRTQPRWVSDNCLDYAEFWPKLPAAL